MMKSYPIDVSKTEFIADRLTPVDLYLKLRDYFPKTCLLESSVYHSTSDSFSILGVSPLSEFILDKNKLDIVYPNGESVSKEIEKGVNIIGDLDEYFSSFKPSMKVSHNGFLGHNSYDSIENFETISLNQKENESYSVASIHYILFKYVLVFDHFHNTLQLIENSFGKNSETEKEDLIRIIHGKQPHTFPFKLEGETESNITDQEYLSMVKKGIEHCFRGDVFQIVLARQFKRKFRGDDFNVYRALRTVNPSPYLYYFDYGKYKIFGSSPESQLAVKDGKAVIHPIAGTFRRTGDDEKDRKLAEKLLQDPKENAEHTMLVDLARNDLSRSCSNVRVEKLKEVQYFSHVIHLVSEVVGDLKDTDSFYKVFGDTFPAGTLSGAPKYKAMQLIDEIENQPRESYAGAVGYIGFDKTINKAIVIRSFTSKDYHLYYQAGAGIVSESDPQKELEEVNNKLLALNTAIEKAETL